ncbi:hypothetical protein ASF92_19945 [Pedobacter sp. Leaf176]|nr:hypothetical protein ASF92_19945 [Pedobacter sp. Leaf176]
MIKQLLGYFSYSNIFILFSIGFKETDAALSSAQSGQPIIQVKPNFIRIKQSFISATAFEKFV